MFINVNGLNNNVVWNNHGNSSGQRLNLNVRVTLAFTFHIVHVLKETIK